MSQPDYHGPFTTLTTNTSQPVRDEGGWGIDWAARTTNTSQPVTGVDPAIGESWTDYVRREAERRTVHYRSRGERESERLRRERDAEEAQREHLNQERLRRLLLANLDHGYRRGEYTEEDYQRRRAEIMRPISPPSQPQIPTKMLVEIDDHRLHNKTDEQFLDIIRDAVKPNVFSRILRRARGHSDDAGGPYSWIGGGDTNFFEVEVLPANSTTAGLHGVSSVFRCRCVDRDSKAIFAGAAVAICQSCGGAYAPEPTKQTVEQPAEKPAEPAKKQRVIGGSARRIVISE